MKGCLSEFQRSLLCSDAFIVFRRLFGTIWWASLIGRPFFLRRKPWFLGKFSNNYKNNIYYGQFDQQSHQFYSNQIIFFDYSSFLFLSLNQFQTSHFFILSHANNTNIIYFFQTIFRRTGVSIPKIVPFDSMAPA